MRKLLPLLALLAAGSAFAVFHRQPEPVSIATDWRVSDPPMNDREPCSGIHGGPYPSRVPRSVLIPSHNTNIRVGYDCFVEDVKVERRLEFRDGKKEIIRYRANGTISERTKYYATVIGDLSRLQSRATFAADGKTYVTHDVYRGDGTLERTGRGSRDGRYVTKYFFEDGVSVERIRNFSPLKEFVSEHIYRRDGTQLAAVTVTEEGLELGVTLYAPDGKMLATFYRTKVSERGTVFGVDGTPMLEYAFDPYTRLAGYMDEKGRLMQKLDVRFGRMTVAFLSRDETRTYTQGWRDSDKVLRTVEERKRNGELVRTISMNRDGTLPKEIAYPEKNGSLVKVLDENGKVVRIKRLDGQNHVMSDVSANESLGDSIPQEALTLPKPTAERPDFRLIGPPLVYDYE